MREADVRRHLDACGVGQRITTVVTSVDVGAAKPDPAPIVEACRRLGVEPSRALLVGDRATDREAAEAAGAQFVATDRGLVDAVERFRALARSAFADACSRVTPLDRAAEAAARARHDTLTKPAGSLGRVEDLGAHLAGIAGRCPPPIPEPAHVAVFAADHGVVASGVTPWPRDVTAQMVANFSRGGAAINVLARQVGATVHVVDVGVATPLPELPGVRNARVRAGTDDLSRGPAMSSVDAVRALDVGVTVATELVAAGAGCLVTGEMGIGNTTPSTALVAVLAGLPASAVTGRGTGIDDEMLRHKEQIVAAAAARAAGWLDPISLLSEIGGLEIAALAGFVTAGASAGVPVIVDGLIACAALLVADALTHGVAERCIAGHRPVEPGGRAALEHLGMSPVLDLDLRLGEGTGACLAVPVVQAAARVLAEMATFAEMESGGRGI
jgi:nicotinate-nucleotide--dimethylbenzimidazole phosphoribosyltransferase